MPNDENAAGTAEQRSVRDVHAEELLGEAWQLDERVRRKTPRYDLDKFELHGEQLLDSPEFKQQFREESLLMAGACAPCIQQDSRHRSDEPHKDLVFVTARANSAPETYGSGGYATIYRCRVCECEVEYSSIDVQPAAWVVRAAQR